MSVLVERRRYHAPRSAPIGRIDLRARRRVHTRLRMKPQSWPTSFWFASALFERGMETRRQRFAAIIKGERG